MCEHYINVWKEAIRILASSTSSAGENSSFLSDLPPKAVPVREGSHLSYVKQVMLCIFTITILRTYTFCAVGAVNYKWQ
jgi:hypothetical protein